MMAGIYIPGMEMPESCYYCPFADGVWRKDKRCLINGEKMPRDGRDVQQNHINCPLVPVPKHGRLIDADAFVMEVINSFMDCADLFDDANSLAKAAEITDAFVRDINEAPTIIPAEEGE